MGPSVARSTTCTSYPRCTPNRHASSPIGPAPVTSARPRRKNARCEIRSTWSHAFASTEVGSSNTPRSPSARGIASAKSGSTRHCSLPYPWRRTIPRSANRSLRHMSHSPAAHAGHGTGSGRRTIPTTRSPALKARAGRCLEHLAQTLVADDQLALARRRLAVSALGDLTVGAAHAHQASRAPAGPRPPSLARGRPRTLTVPALAWHRRDRTHRAHAPTAPPTLRHPKRRTPAASPTRRIVTMTSSDATSLDVVVIGAGPGRRGRGASRCATRGPDRACHTRRVRRHGRQRRTGAGPHAGARRASDARSLAAPALRHHRRPTRARLRAAARSRPRGHRRCAHALAASRRSPTGRSHDSRARRRRVGSPNRT